jgi:hypothetical protein
MKKKVKIFNWSWIKENFWNVVAVMILWQIIVYVIFTLLMTIFKIEIPII